MLIETIGSESNRNMYCVEVRGANGYVDVFADTEADAWNRVEDEGYDPYKIVKYG